MWTDIDWEAGTVTIRRSVRSRSGHGVTITDVKTPRAKRTIELSGSALALLKHHRQMQREARLRMGPRWHEQGLLFPSSVGTPWEPGNFYRAFKSIAAASSVEDPQTVHVHSLRHTAATQWIRAGADIHTVSRRLGHASASFTLDRYGHLLVGMQRTAAEAMDHLLA